MSLRDPELYVRNGFFEQGHFHATPAEISWQKAMPEIIPYLVQSEIAYDCALC